MEENLLANIAKTMLAVEKLRLAAIARE